MCGGSSSPCGKSKTGSTGEATIVRTCRSLFSLPCPKAAAARQSIASLSDDWILHHSFRPDDYVFLNDEPFSEEFKRHTSGIASGVCKYGLVPKEHWEEPPWIDEEKAAKARKEMEDKKVIYGGSKAYRRMCESTAPLCSPILARGVTNPEVFECEDRSLREWQVVSVRTRARCEADDLFPIWTTGFFFRHPLLDQYDYYWVHPLFCCSIVLFLTETPARQRLDPSVKFYCDFDYDPFMYMQQNKKKYGWTVSERDLRLVRAPLLEIDSLHPRPSGISL